MENKIAEIGMVYKTRVKAADRKLVKNSQDAFEALFSTWDSNTIEHVEEFKILLLNRAHKVLGVCNISKGGITGTVIDVRVILQFALKANATSMIISHNHPSGNKNPSEADINITRKIKNACELMDITMLDHLIILPDESFFSLTDNGVI